VENDEGDPTELNAETRTLSLSARDLRDATRLLTKLIATGGSASPGSAAPSAVSLAHRRRLIDHARQLVWRRRKGEQQFGRGIFGEPAWEMLLLLYTTEDEARAKISRVVTAAGAPATTGLRWLNYLELQELVCRQPHPTDARVEPAELTFKGRAALDSHFSETFGKGE
jgi:DNA-binding MarR family transcriptional regulator